MCSGDWKLVCRSEKALVHIDLPSSSHLKIDRDMLKTWLQSNDIKDKSALLENRKLIEVVSNC